MDVVDHDLEIRSLLGELRELAELQRRMLAVLIDTLQSLGPVRMERLEVQLQELTCLEHSVRSNGAK